MKLPVPTLCALLAACALLCGVSVASAGTTRDVAPVVSMPAGAVRGVRDGNLNAFLAIPYALPPTGDRRWRPPAPMPRWSGVRAVQQAGVSCFQPPMADGPYKRPPRAMAEDCLTLDVTAPANAQGAPVMVWIHGGTLIWGTAHSPMYDGRHFARRGVVLVSINYRLGVLGYLAHPELSGESPEGVSGNYGLLDQIAALRWIRENIGAFGGDARNVTIFGESAGALSVEYLLASPRARGYFDKAIIQSGYLFTMPELRNTRYEERSAEEIGTAYATKLGAANIAALRAMDAQTLVNTPGYAPFGTIDGKVLPRQLVDTFDRGEQAPVPLMAGFNSGEVRSLKFLLPPSPASPQAYAADIRAHYGDLADDYLRLYPAQNLAEAQLAATRDAIFGWAAERLVRNQSDIGQPSYLYYFSHEYPTATTAGLAAFHASEVPFVFGTFSGTPPNWPAIPDTASERQLAESMLDYWTSFARTGRPTAAYGPDWEPFAPGGRYMNFGDEPQLSRPFMPGMYVLHEKVVCRRRQDGSQSWNWRTGSLAPVLRGPTPQCP